MNENKQGQEISAKMSEAIAQAKRNVQNLRDREKLALQAQSEAENLRKRRQKGGAAKLRKANAELTEVLELKRKADLALKALEGEQLELEEKTGEDEGYVKDGKVATGEGEGGAFVGQGTEKDKEETTGPEETTDLEEMTGVEEDQSAEKLDADICMSLEPKELHDAIMDEAKGHDEAYVDDAMNLITDNQRDKLMSAMQDSEVESKIITKGEPSGTATGDAATGDDGSEEDEDGSKSKEKKGKQLGDGKSKEERRITMQYRSGDDTTKAEIRRAVEAAVQRYLEDPDHRTIPYKWRRLIREIQEVCPEAANTTRQLALHCFETNRGNRICPYHGEKDKAGTLCDMTTTDESLHRVTGTPFERQVNNKRQGKTSEKRKHILDCGCIEDEALLDFYWWKQITVISPSTNIEEGWKEQRLDPRARAFMKSEWEFISFLTVNDIYTNGQGQLVYEATRYARQIKSLQKSLETAKRDLSKLRNA